MERNENGYIRRVIPENTQPGQTPDMEADVQLGCVYSPYQFFRQLYEPHDAMRHGTLFEELYKPLEGGPEV